MDNKLIKQLQNSIKNRRLFIGGSMVLDPDFDIKNYLPDFQKQKELEKIIFNAKNPLPNIKNNPHRLIKNNYSSKFNNINYNEDENKKDRKKNLIINTISNEKRPLITLNNLLSLSKDNIFNNRISNTKRKNIVITDLNLEKNLYEANNSIQSTKNKIEKMIKKNIESAKSSNSIFHNKLLKPNEPRFNIIKTIKEIKRREKSSRQRNIIEENNKIFIQRYKTLEEPNDIYIKTNNNKNTIQNPVAFDRRHEKVVFEPIKVLNEYKVNKDLQINIQEKSINNFNNQNKQLSVSNVLVKLMNLETNKLSKNFNLRSDILKNNKKTIETNEADFEDYKDTQKQVVKQLDGLYITIQKKNKELIEESLNCKTEIKLIEDEMKRLLHQIDYLRVYGYFVNDVLGGDTTRFENKIFPEQKYNDEIDIEELTKTVIKKYRCFYDDNTKEEKFEIENTFINEPEKMWFKFKEMEGIMVRNIFTKESIKGDIKKINEEGNINLKHLRQKHEILEKENKIINDKYEYELSKYNEIEKKYNYEKSEFDDLIKDFYIYIVNSSNKDNIFHINKKLYNKLDVLDCIKEIHNNITDKEILIDKLTTNLKKWEKNDPKIFEEVANNRKKIVKHIKQLKLINKKMNEKFKFVNKGDNSQNKFILYSRKTEAPYHKPKKIVKEKVDEKLIEQLENEELLNYGDV